MTNSAQRQRFLHVWRADRVHAACSDLARYYRGAVARRLRPGGASCGGSLGCQHSRLPSHADRYGDFGGKRARLLCGQPGPRPALLPAQGTAAREAVVLHPIPRRSGLLGGSLEGAEQSKGDRRWRALPHPRSGIRPHKTLAWALVRADSRATTNSSPTCRC
jgi:hypothetical protein